MPYRGVIFDFGGVISDMRWDVARQLEEEHGLESLTLLRTYYDTDEWRAVQIGAGDPEAWRESAHRRLEEVAGRPLPRLHDQWRSSVRLIDDNLDLIRSLRSGYRVSVLSNADKTLEDRMRDGLDIRDLFHDVISSADVGLAKPDHRIFRLAAYRLGVPIAECLFIDDAPRNVTAATDVGMGAVHYRVDKGDDLREMLAALGVDADSFG